MQSVISHYLSKSFFVAVSAYHFNSNIVGKLCSRCVLGLFYQFVLKSEESKMLNKQIFIVNVTNNTVDQKIYSSIVLFYILIEILNCFLMPNKFLLFAFALMSFTLRSFSLYQYCSFGSEDNSLSTTKYGIIFVFIAGILNCLFGLSIFYIADKSPIFALLPLGIELLTESIKNFFIFCSE